MLLLPNGKIFIVGTFGVVGRADISVFRSSSGAWYRLNSSNNQFVAVSFGANGDAPVLGDFDGDTKTDIAVFRPSNGTWCIQRSASGFTAVPFGASGDLPIPSVFLP